MTRPVCHSSRRPGHAAVTMTLKAIDGLTGSSPWPQPPRLPVNCLAWCPAGPGAARARRPGLARSVGRNATVPPNLRHASTYQSHKFRFKFSDFPPGFILYVDIALALTFPNAMNPFRPIYESCTLGITCRSLTFSKARPHSVALMLSPNDRAEENNVEPSKWSQLSFEELRAIQVKYPDNHSMFASMKVSELKHAYGRIHNHFFIF